MRTKIIDTAEVWVRTRVGLGPSMSLGLSYIARNTNTYRNGVDGWYIAVSERMYWVIRIPRPAVL